MISLQHQTILHDEGAGIIGNCWATCIAMVLGVPLSEVPSFSLQGQTLEALNWLLGQGLDLLYEDSRPDAKVCIAAGIGPRRLRHCVVLERREDGTDTVYDPHPSGEGLIVMDGYYVIERFSLEDKEPTP